MRSTLAALIGLALAAATGVHAQQQQPADGESTAVIFFSPIPRARVTPAPVETQDPETTQTGEGQPADPGQEPQQPAGDSAQVRVVYGTTGSTQNRTVPRSQVAPQTETATPTPEPADDEQTAALDPDEPAWKRDRAKRFRRAPERKARQTYEVSAPIVPIETPDTELMRGARLRQLDKMTGQIETFEVAVGEVRQIARLRIELAACRAPGDNDTHGTMAFMKIWDTKNEGDPPQFTGWMFAESPALSALDHPRYDLWVISCTTSAGVTAVSNE